MLRVLLRVAVFKSENVTGYANGQTDGTINGFGCAHNMISVGAYVSRVSAPYINEGNYSGSGTQGDIAAFSSYGELADGRRLPHVCAPGAQIVSSVSTYWIKNLPGFNKAWKYPMYRNVLPYSRIHSCQLWFPKPCHR